MVLVLTDLLTNFRAEDGAMKPQDNPETLMMDEQTRWEATQMEDVFLPSVRVQIGWRDLEEAVNRGAVVPQYAHALWAGWAAPGSATRVTARTSAPNFESTLSQQLDEDSASASGGVLPYAIALVVGLVLGAVGAWLALG